MEPKDQLPPKIVFIQLNQSNQNQPDPELMNWLANLMKQMEDDGLIDFGRDYGEEHNEMDEIALIDSMVSGDEHPEALSLIMGAYQKHQKPAA